MSKDSDLALGLSEEKRLFSRIKGFIGDPTLMPTSAKFATFDFVGDSAVGELKTRRIRHDKYSHIFVGYNKVGKWKDLHAGKDLYIFYSCTDGLYYVKMPKNGGVLKGCILKEDHFARADRGSVERSNLLLIPTGLLNPI